jgi:NADP-dependent 3-hydroxy acid dehydrogenase YdfG
MDLPNKVVIITGASMGIGAATARAFVQAGAKVVLAARSEEPLVALARELGDEKALAAPTDVTVRAQIDALVRRTLEHYGRIDILVNNAGVAMAGPVATMDTAKQERIFATNVLGPLYGIQAVVPQMRQQGGGLIINISSMATKLVIPTLGGYRATKQALNAISDNARLELARDNIRVLTVYPGQTDTHRTSSGQGGQAQSAEFVAQRIVEGARKEPREVFMTFGHRMIALVGTVLPRTVERLMAGRMPQ